MRLSSEKQCSDRVAAAGFTLDYIGAYDDVDQTAVRQSTGLGDYPQIIAVEPTSPAYSAGIRAGDSLVMLEGKPIFSLLRPEGDPALLVDAIHDEIAKAGPKQKLVLSGIRNGHPMEFILAPMQVCAARFVLKLDEAIAAFTDGKNIAVTTGLMRFIANDDELALVAGHELAHVNAFDAMPAGLFGQRRQEDAADLNGARLAYCAGYSVENALGFWKRLARSNGPEGPAHRPAGERLSRLEIAANAFRCE